MAEKQFVIFKLGEQNYCVDIMDIGGITEYKESTKIPESPYFVEGVINLRGSVIPIINLKKRFGIAEERKAEDCRVVLYNMNGTQIGFLVDEANQVIKLNSEDIDPTPEIIKGEDKHYIDGMGKMGEQIVIVINFAKILTDVELNQVTQMNM